MPTDTEFPQTLEAFREAEGGVYKVCRALVRECGPPGEHGVTDGALRRIRQCQAYLKRHGYEYSLDYLRDLRSIGANFAKLLDGGAPPSLAVLSAAYDQETLDEARADAELRGVALTADFVRDFKRRRRGEPEAQGSFNPANLAAIESFRRACAEVFDRLTLEEVAGLWVEAAERANAWPDVHHAAERFVAVKEAAE